MPLKTNPHFTEPLFLLKANNKSTRATNPKIPLKISFIQIKPIMNPRFYDTTYKSKEKILSKETLIHNFAPPNDTLVLWSGNSSIILYD